MLFNSLGFALFFPIAVISYYILPHRVRYIWLLICSYYFYMSWNVWYVSLIFVSTIVTYFTGLAIEFVGGGRLKKDKKKSKIERKFLVFCIMINLGILVYFKYSNFIIMNLEILFGKIGMEVPINHIDMLLPVGISFYTFQALSYSVDIYRGTIKAERNFFKYALFVSFFPQLVAGPIERSSSLLKQIHDKHKFNYELVRDGLLLMLWGYFIKMVIADRIAIFVDKVYGDYSTYGGWYLVIATVLFGIQIYCDFAGYSIIAMGSAKVMGFKLIDNFNAPYMSCTISEFWRRWHVSLFSWFKDYIYIPLGGSKKGKVRKYVNILIVFLVSGFWHGAKWSFVAWGLLNGIYQIIGELILPFRDKVVSFFHLKRESISHNIGKVFITFFLVDFSWLFFRADSFLDAINIIKSIFLVKNFGILFDDSIFLLGLDWKNFIVMLISIFVLLFADCLKYRGIVIRDMLYKQEWWFRWMVYVIGILAIVIFGIWGTGYDAASFIYFQF